MPGVKKILWSQIDNWITVPSGDKEKQIREILAENHLDWEIGLYYTDDQEPFLSNLTEDNSLGGGQELLDFLQKAKKKILNATFDDEAVVYTDSAANYNGRTASLSSLTPKAGEKDTQQEELKNLLDTLAEGEPKPLESPEPSQSKVALLKPGPPYIVRISWKELKDQLDKEVAKNSYVKKALKALGKSRRKITFEFVLNSPELPPSGLTKEDFDTNFPNGEMDEFFSRAVDTRNKLKKKFGKKTLTPTYIIPTDKALSMLPPKYEKKISWSDLIKKIPINYPDEETYKKILAILKTEKSDFSISILCNNPIKLEALSEFSFQDLQLNFLAYNIKTHAYVNTLVDFLDFCSKSKNKYEKTSVCTEYLFTKDRVDSLTEQKAKAEAERALKEKEQKVKEEKEKADKEAEKKANTEKSKNIETRTTPDLGRLITSPSDTPLSNSLEEIGRQAESTALQAGATSPTVSILSEKPKDKASYKITSFSCNNFRKAIPQNYPDSKTYGEILGILEKIKEKESEEGENFSITIINSNAIELGGRISDEDLALNFGDSQSLKDFLQSALTSFSNGSSNNQKTDVAKSSFSIIKFSLDELKTKIPENYPTAIIYKEILETLENFKKQGKNFSISILHDNSTNSEKELSDKDLVLNFYSPNGSGSLTNFLKSCLHDSKENFKTEAAKDFSDEEFLTSSRTTIEVSPLILNEDGSKTGNKAISPIGIEGVQEPLLSSSSPTLTYEDGDPNEDRSSERVWEEGPKNWKKMNSLKSAGGEKSGTFNKNPVFMGATSDSASAIDTSATFYKLYRQQVGMSLAQLAERPRKVVTAGKEMDLKEFEEFSKAWHKKIDLKKKKDGNAIKYHDVTCKIDSNGLMTTTIKFPGKIEKIEHSYDKDVRCPKVKMTNPPDDKTIILFMESSKEMAPLKLQTKCAAQDALRLFEASVISGTKIELHEENQKELADDPRYKNLESLLKDKEALQELREAIAKNPSYELGRSKLPEPKKADTITFKGSTGDKRKKK